MKKYLLLLITAFLFMTDAAMSETIKGIVTDDNQKPLTAIQVVFRDTTNNQEYSVFSNRYGEYKIDIEPNFYKVYLRIMKLQHIDNFEINTTNQNELDIQIDFEKFEFEYNRDYLYSVKRMLRGNDYYVITDQSYMNKDGIIIRSHIDYIETIAGSVSEDSHKRPVYEGGGMDDALMPHSSEGKGTASASKVEVMAASPEKMDIMVKSSVEGAGGSLIATNRNLQAGQLTSGEVNDFRKWDMWNDLTDDEFKQHSEQWSLFPENRYTVQLVNRNNTPMIDTKVKLKDKNGNIFWEGRTDNTGKAELWFDMYGQIDYQSMTEYDVEIEQEDENIEYPNVTKFYDGVNIVNTPDDCMNYDNLDILFAVDATGSMSDEISYLQAELIDIITRVKEKHDNLNVNLGSLFYRDLGDDYVLKSTPFSNDIQKTIDFINEQEAGGGGDFPEAVDIAMMTAANQYNWSDKAVARLMFLILDAPPHDDKETIERVQELSARLAMDGIRVIPVACSGVNKSTEFILRSIALATNGTYVFLTDDSGIGNPHIEPSTDEYEVEKLNDLFIRLIDQFTIAPACDNFDLADKDISDKIFNEGDALKGVDDIADLIDCYPNPSDGLFTMKLAIDIEELYIVDIAGKILKKMNYTNAGTHSINISDFPSGVYYVKFLSGKEWGSKRVLVQR